MAILRERKGENPGKVYPVVESRQATVLGRDEGIEVSLDDGRSSRRHARIVRVFGTWVIQDLNSSNGTMVDGEKVDKRVLEDGATLQIGNTLLQFEADTLPPPLAVEVEGSRLLETIYEEEGIFVYRAYQAALDREVRIDRFTESRPAKEEIRETLAGAVQAAARTRHDHIEPVVESDLNNDHGAYVVIKSKNAVPLSDHLDELLAADLGVRLALFHSLADVVLTRATDPLLAIPLTLRQIKVRVESETPVAYIAGIEIPAFVSARYGTLCHIPQYVPYLPPELASGESLNNDSAGPATVYSLAAIGYHLLTGRRPMGDGKIREILDAHKSTPPTPPTLLESALPETVSQLLERMLAKRPEERPLQAEILAVLQTHELPRESFTLSSENASSTSDSEEPPLAASTPAPPTAPAYNLPPRAAPTRRASTRAASRAVGRNPAPLVTPGGESPRAPTADATRTAGPASETPAERSERRSGLRSDERRERAVANVVSLPFWIVLWAALVIGGWQVSRMLFETFLG